MEGKEEASNVISNKKPIMQADQNFSTMITSDINLFSWYL